MDVDLNDSNHILNVIINSDNDSLALKGFYIKHFKEPNKKYASHEIILAADLIEWFKDNIKFELKDLKLETEATVGSMIFAEPVVTLLFGRGKFDAGAIAMTSVALFFYSLGMLGFGLREVLSRAFYSLQDTKTPAINAAIAVVMNIILNIILSKYMGIGGLALATSISAVFCTLLLFISLRKKIGALVYFVMIYFMGIEEVDVLVGMLKGKFKSN